MSSTTSEHLAANMRQLRDGRGFSQQQAAKIATVPRATWANLESGTANPTLAVLVKVAAALHVSVEELIGPPRTSAQLFRAGSLVTRRRGQISVRRLLPEAIVGLDIERMQLPPGAAMTGTPHTAGTREYFTCESGTVELTESGKSWRLEPGDVVVFRGDQKHGYRNPGRKQAVAYSVVAFAPI